MRGCGAVKVSASFFKYMPQVVFNFQRKSTKGFSATGMALDFVGGMFSIAQQFLSAYTLGNFAPFTHNFAKTFLALETLLFDTILLAQHVMYGGGSQSLLPPAGKSDCDIAALLPNRRQSSTED